MKPFEVSIDVVIIRFFLMMGVVITGFLTHQFWLCLLALPIFLSMILGIRFSFKKEVTTSAKIIKMKNTERTYRQAS